MMNDSSPDRKQLADAVRKGLGRSLLWAMRGVWNDKDVLLDACTNDLRYDRQCEEPRGPWLWQLIEIIGAREEFAESILECLKDLENKESDRQLCELALSYAKGGDVRFRQRLYEIVADIPNPHDPSLGQTEIVALDGLSGFEFAAQVRERSLATREWEWHDGRFVDEGTKRLGEEAVMSVLDRIHAGFGTDRLASGWRSDRSRKPSVDVHLHQQRMRSLKLEDIVRAAENNEGPGVSRLFGWGIYADEATLRTVRDRMMGSSDPKIIANYLKVFNRTPLPDCPERFLTYLHHPDRTLQARAFRAIANKNHPAIRQFALENLVNRIRETDVLSLFVQNFVPGDESRLVSAVALLDDTDDWHRQWMDLIRILENNPNADCRELAVLAFERTPCSACRHNAVKLMVARKVAPDWLIEECRYDVVEDTRNLASTT